MRQKNIALATMLGMALTMAPSEMLPTLLNSLPSRKPTQPKVFTEFDQARIDAAAAKRKRKLEKLKRNA